MPDLLIQDTRLYYEDTGAGSETIVFSHGLLCDTKLFAPQVQALRTNYRCISYDHRGQGRSQVPDAPMIDLETLYTDAVHLIERLEAAPCHFVGLSMGGFVGMRLAARRPDLVRSLTLISTAPDPEPAPNQHKYRALSTVARTLGPRVVRSRVVPIMLGKSFLQDPARRRERDLWIDHFDGLPRSIYKAVRGVIYRPSVVCELARIEAPTLVLWGEEDAAIAESRSRLLEQHIPDVRFHKVPRAGHSATVENPDAITLHLRTFLAEA